MSYPHQRCRAARADSRPKSRYEKQIDSASRLVVKHRAHAWLSRCVSASIRTASTRDAGVHSSMTSIASADRVPYLTHT